jgi:hypothetical protein
VIKIPSIKRNHLVVVSAVLIIATVTLAAYFTVLSPPAQGFQIDINPIDPADLGVAEWMEDFQALYDFIEGNYPFLDVKNRTHGFDWLDMKEYYENRISDCQNNLEFLRVIMDALNALQNRHTWIMHPDNVVAMANDVADFYPLNEIFCQEVVDECSYWGPKVTNVWNQNYDTVFNVLIVYDKGEYVVRNYNASWEAEFGNDTIVTHVNGDPVDDAIETLFEVSYIDHDFIHDKNYVWSIYPRDFGGDAVFTVENSTGYIEDVTFEVVSSYANDPYEYPATPFSTMKYESDSIAYAYVGTFGTGLDAYGEEALTFYSEIEDYDHLIIDIRGNNGGFYSKWINGIVEPLIQDTVVYNQYLGFRNSPYATQTQAYMLTDIVPKTDISYLPPEAQTDNYTIYRNTMTFNPMGEFEFTGNIVVLMDNYVYSAAEGFVNFCKETGFATLYGTASGGDGLMIRPFNFVLPNSKLVINSASALGLDSTGHVNEEVRTQPDVVYESSFGNWTELIDFTIAELLSG